MSSARGLSGIQSGRFVWVTQFRLPKPARRRLLRLALDGSKNSAELRELARRFADRTPDLADLCLIQMDEICPRHSVITVDEGDFRVYRWNKKGDNPPDQPTDRGVKFAAWK